MTINQRGSWGGLLHSVGKKNFEIWMVCCHLNEILEPKYRKYEKLVFKQS